MMADQDRFPELPVSDARVVESLVHEVVDLNAEQLRRYPWLPADVSEAVTGLRLQGRAATLNDLRRTLEEYVGPNAVWMDATTLYRTLRLLAADSAAARPVFDPLALLDLDGFVRSFLLYDQVVAIRNDPDSEWGDMRPLNESMNEAVFVTLLPDGAVDPAVEELFHSLFFQARDWVTQATSGGGDPVMAPQFAAWQRSARQIYGTVPDHRTQMRLIQSWGSVADYVARLLMRPDSKSQMSSSVMWAEVEELQHKLIAEATVRAVFNTELSRGLGLRYAPAAARLPTVAAYDAARAFTAVDALAALVTERRLELLKELAQVHHRVVSAAPAWAAMLLSRVERPADLWPELVALRQQTATLRARRSALDEELSGAGEERALKEMRQALRAESSSLLAAWGGTGAHIALGVTASALTGGPWGFGFVAGLAAMLGAEFISDQPQKLRARLLKPRRAQITHLGSQVKGLRQSLPKAQEIWDLTDDSIRHIDEVHSRMTAVGWV